MKKIVGRTLFSFFIVVAFVGSYYFFQSYIVPEEDEPSTKNRSEIPMHGAVAIPGLVSTTLPGFA